MKKLFLCRLMLLATLSCVFVIASQATEKGNNNLSVKHVLMLGLSDNVKSNFYKGRITEETGIEMNMIDKEYNAIIMENIMASSNGVYKFIPASAEETPVHRWTSLIKTNGEGDECYSDISLVPSDEYRNTLDMAEAEYLLVLNQHYLKWQERPMRTLFHVVSYTLFDKDKNEVYRGNSYFTSMNLEPPDKLRKTSSKTSSRIASTIINQIK